VDAGRCAAGIDRDEALESAARALPRWAIGHCLLANASNSALAASNARLDLKIRIIGMQAGVGAAALRLLCPLARHPERSSRFSASSVKLAARTHSLAWYSAISLNCVLDDISASPWDEGMIHAEPFAAVIAVGNLVSVRGVTTSTVDCGGAKIFLVEARPAR
jgi:hypothetical protein